MTVRRLTCFDSASPEYTRAFQTFLAHTDQKARALDWLAREVDALGRHEVAIDAGAGTGKLTAWLMQRFATVVGIEPNPTLSSEFAATCPGLSHAPADIGADPAHLDAGTSGSSCINPRPASPQNLNLPIDVPARQRRRGTRRLEPVRNLRGIGRQAPVIR